MDPQGVREGGGQLPPLVHTGLKAQIAAHVQGPDGHINVSVREARWTLAARCAHAATGFFHCASF